MNKTSFSGNRQGILIGTSVFLFLFVFMKFLLGPAFGDLRSKHADVRKAKKSLANIKTAREKLPQLEAEIVRLRQKAEELESRLPSKTELPELLERLSEVAERSRMKIIEIHPFETVQAEGIPSATYEELLIAITAKSGYHELGSFISQLESSKRMFVVREIMIQFDPGDQKKHHIKLVVVTFVRQKESP